jgi:hypothetical protein
VEILETWIKPRGDEIHDLCSYPYFIRVIELKTRNRTGKVAGVGDIRNTYRFLVRKPEKDQLQYISIGKY